MSGRSTKPVKRLPHRMPVNACPSSWTSVTPNRTTRHSGRTVTRTSARAPTISRVRHERSGSDAEGCTLRTTSSTHSTSREATVRPRTPDGTGRTWASGQLTSGAPRPLPPGLPRRHSRQGPGGSRWSRDRPIEPHTAPPAAFGSTRHVRTHPPRSAPRHVRLHPSRSAPPTTSGSTERRSEVLPAAGRTHPRRDEGLRRPRRPLPRPWTGAAR